MPRHARGVTLTPEERALVAPVAGRNGSGGQAVQSHSLTVVLPDGTSCPVAYSRSGPRSHRFEFAAPLLQCLWAEGRLDGIAAIEEKAKELTTDALRKAREEEKKMLQRKIPPPGRSLQKPDTYPQ